MKFDYLSPSSGSILRTNLLVIVLCSLITSVFVATPLSVKADVYKYVDKDGHVFLTDRPNHKGYKLLVRTWKGWQEKKFSGAGLAKRQEKYAEMIKAAAELNKLPVALVHAVITAESAYQPKVISKAGAVGMMQLMPATAERYGVKDSKDAEANIAGGTKYLRDLLKMFDNDTKLAVAAYNAGEGAVMKYGNTIPPYKETQHYVIKVLKYYKKYSTTL